ncbi:MAG: S-layer homology domain-containing protein [Actinomycetota bacterium]
MLKRIAAFAITISILLMLLPGSAGAAPYEYTFYITPNCGIPGDYNSAYQKLVDMKTRLGTGQYYARTGFMACCYYMGETKGRASDFEFDPSHLEYILKLAKDINFPVVICFNGGPWADLANPDRDIISYLEQDPMHCQWRDSGIVPEDDGTGLKRLLTYNNWGSRAEARKGYRKRNLQAAARVVTQFYRENPDILIAVTIDPEIFMSPFFITDYNPDTIAEFRQFERDERFKGNLNAFNQAMGTNFNSWDEVVPPRGNPLVGNPLWEEWTNFRIGLVYLEVQREVDWIREAGLPASKIFTHQTVRTDNTYWMRYILCSTLDTAHVNEGSLGITTLQNVCFDEALFAAARGLSPNWGIFEFNPSLESGPDYNRCLSALKVAYKHGAHIIAPYTWDGEGREPFYNIKDTAFERAIRDFIDNLSTRFRDVPRDFWAYNEIESIAQQGIISGYADGYFRPADPVFRSQFTKMLVNSLGLPLNTQYKGYFTDVPSNHWGWQYIETAYERGIVKGYGDGRFGPEDMATRAQLAKILVLGLGISLNTQYRGYFPDVPSSHWAWQYIETAKDYRIIQGYLDGRFKPEEIVRRDQTAVMISRAKSAP